jgi:MFS family permease
MMGTFLVLPILPYYVTELGGSVFVFTCLVSAFSLATLISAPFWGRFSDRHGRRPAVLIALGASALAYLVFGFATSIWMLFISRLVQGAGGGTVGVIQAYLTDVTESKNRAKALGWLSAATNFGVMVGPLVGSLAVRLGRVPLSSGPHPFMLGRSSPGILAALICTVNMIFVSAYLTETRTPRPVDRRLPTENARTIMWKLVTHVDSPASRLIAIYAVGLGAFYGGTSVLVYYMRDRFGVTKETVGYFFTYVGFLSIVARAVLLGFAIDWLGEARLSRVGTVMLVLGLIFVPLAPNIPLFALAASMFPLGTAFMFPCVTAILSRVIPQDERGGYMGAQQAFGGIARVVFPLGAGLLYDHFVPGVPFWASAILVAATLFLGFDMESYVRPPTTEAECEAVVREAGEPVGP